MMRHLTLAPIRYATVVVDPPWSVKSGPLRGREGFIDATGPARPLPYRSMSVEQIMAIPIDRVAAADAHLYLWTICRYLEAAYHVARAWGFRPVTPLVWAKACMGGGLGGAFGISTEFLLFCRRGRLSTMDRISGSWFSWKRPYDRRGKPRHSAKPPEARAMIERVSPGPRAEIFAREIAPGWDVWGDEVVCAPSLMATLGAPT